MLELIQLLWERMGLSSLTPGNVAMIVVGLALVYLAVKKNYEPLILLPIGITAVLVNLPLTGLVEPGGLGEAGFLYMVKKYLIDTEIVPLLIFLGLGALTDFGPMLANPKSLLLGAAAQIGVFVAMFTALALGFNLCESASIGIIGGADGPTTIYLTVELAPHLLAATAVAAYSYMSLVPLIQPPVIKALTTREERRIRMRQLRPVSRTEKILFPITALIIIGLLVPSAAPLVGMIMIGNLFRESGVVERLRKAASEELMNIVTIFLGLGIGSTMVADYFLRTSTLLILALGVVAFASATAAGVLFAKLMNIFSREKINPMIGAAGVSAVPMSARVVQRLAVAEDPENHVLMHAMGPNIAGVIGTAVAAGVFLSLLRRSGEACISSAAGPTLWAGLEITLIGIGVVFAVLALLTIVIMGLERILYREKRSAREAAPSRGEEQVVEEGKAPITAGQGGLSPEEVSIIVSAIAGFAEYKERKLGEYTVFREFPPLRKLLPLAGVFFQATLKVSIGGAEKEVRVRELPGGALMVEYDGKKHVVQISMGKKKQ